MTQTIFERELAGEMISPGDPEFPLLLSAIERAYGLTDRLNRLSFKDPKAHAILSELFGCEFAASNTLIPPFYTDFGKNTRIGNQCFIQQCCLFFDRGGITIGDNVFIGPKVNLITLNHDMAPGNRATTCCKPIRIEDNAWIGVGAAILPGVTVGKNAVIAAGSVVVRDVAPNTIVGGNPAKFIKNIPKENL